MLKKFYSYLASISRSNYGSLILIFLFFIESIFLFLPMDPILILYCSEDYKKSMWFGFLATTASVLGGITAYFIGYYLWHSLGSQIVELISTQSKFEAACNSYKTYETVAVLIGGISPFPYKIVTLSAGFCRLPLIPFIFYSLISRGIRFFFIAALIRSYGPQVKNFIENYFNQIVLLFTILFILGIYLIT